MPDTTQLIPIDVDAELDRLAQRYRAAGGIGVQVLTLFGGKAEGLFSRPADGNALYPTTKRD